MHPKKEGSQRLALADCYTIMGNIAAVFHWPPDLMWDMDIDELIIWEGEARQRGTPDE